MPRLFSKIPVLFFCLAQAASTLAAGDPIDLASGNAVPSVPEIANQGYKLAFSDEFNGTSLDEEKWNYRIDSKGLSTQLPANATVSGGCLHVAVKKESSGGKPYTAGGVISKTEFMHGYYEARFKIPAGKGWHTSFYTEHYNGKDTQVTPGREEIDICEQNSSSGKAWGYNYTLHDWGSKLLPKGSEVPAPKLPAGHAKPSNVQGDLHDFHIWGMEFTPIVVNFYFDGELRGSVDATLFKHTPMNIWLTSIGWGGSIDDGALPSEAQFDYVRYFTRPEAQPPSTGAATNTTSASASATDPTQAGLIDALTKMGAVVKTKGDAPDGAVTSIIFPYTHTRQQAPGGDTIPPYPVTDDLVHQISKLPKVTALEMNMSPGLTEAAIKDIGSMKQLEHLSLNGMHLTDASMADLAGLTNLNYLRLSGATGITDIGWATLENFKQLQTLWIAETKFGDAAMQHLKPLTQLKDMTFYGTPVTDAGADVLLGLPNLTSIRVGPHMTPTEIAKLQAALPKCRFFR